MELLGIPYDPVEVDPAAVPEPYRLISPRGIIPALIDGETSLYGSSVINEYLDARFCGHLMPSDPAQAAKVRMLMRDADMEFLPVLNGLMWAVRDGADPALIQALRKQAADRLEEFEGLFDGEWLFLAGPDLTLADVAFATTIPHLVEYGYQVQVPEDLARTQRWIAAMRETPEWRALGYALTPPTERTEELLRP